MKKYTIKNQKGAISLFVLLSMMFFLTFMLGAFTLVNRRNAMQAETLEETQKIYSSKPSAADQYDEIFSSESSYVPITNLEQLKEAVRLNGTSEEIKYLINNKVYKYNKDAKYILTNDIVLDYESVVGNNEYSFEDFKIALEEYMSIDNINLNNNYIYYKDANNKNINLNIADKIVYFEKNNSENNNIILITKDNMAEYFGKEIEYNTNVTVINDHPVSTTYRLFYIDFDNKYGDGEGTIYLKADVAAGNKPAVQCQTGDNGKIWQLSPKMRDKISNVLNNSGFRSAVWLLDPNNWNNLKVNSLGDNVNYVVGSPTVELFIDSYNSYIEKYHPQNYNGALAQKMTCQFVLKSENANYNETGYIVGLTDGVNEIWTNNGMRINDGELINESVCNGMYDNGNYRLASNSVGHTNALVTVSKDNHRTGYIVYSGANYGVCPVVSIKSDALLRFVSL